MDFQPWKDYLQLASVIQMMKSMDIINMYPAKDHLLDPANTSETSAEDECHIYSKVRPNSLLTYSPGLPNSLCSNSPVQANTPCTSPRIHPKLSLGHHEARSRGSMCHFCKHNGESRCIYTGHNLKDEEGRIICPVLKMYTCSLCGATGESSHTKKYCPLNKNKQSPGTKAGRNSFGRRVKR